MRLWRIQYSRNAAFVKLGYNPPAAKLWPQLFQTWNDWLLGVKSHPCFAPASIDKSRGRGEGYDISNLS